MTIYRFKTGQKGREVMNEKQFMVQGKRTYNGAVVRGYLYPQHPSKGKTWCIQSGMCSEYFEVDLKTVERVAVKVCIEPVYGYEDTQPSEYSPSCPDCGDILDFNNQYKFCPECGQRLEW